MAKSCSPLADPTTRRVAAPLAILLCGFGRSFEVRRLNLQGVTIGIQVGVLETCRILQSVSEQSIKTNVGYPDEGEREHRSMIGNKGTSSQYQRGSKAMHRVIRDRSNANVGGIAEHRDVRHKKQQRKLKPTSLYGMIGEEADDQYSR